MAILQQIDTETVPISCQAIILCPSGEVVEQVFDALTRMGGPSGIEVFGAVDDSLSEEDVEVFEIGVHVVIAMPSLVSTLFSRGCIKGSTM
jgi:superfamily II DNA/RNA helicase